VGAAGADGLTGGGLGEQSSFLPGAAAAPRHGDRGVRRPGLGPSPGAIKYAVPVLDRSMATVEVRAVPRVRLHALCAGPIDRAPCRMQCAHLLDATAWMSRTPTACACVCPALGAVLFPRTGAQEGLMGAHRVARSLLPPSGKAAAALRHSAPNLHAVTGPAASDAGSRRTNLPPVAAGGSGGGSSGTGPLARVRSASTAWASGAGGAAATVGGGGEKRRKRRVKSGARARRLRSIAANAELTASLIAAATGTVPLPTPGLRRLSAGGSSGDA
jgi:hypothetical protein